MYGVMKNANEMESYRNREVKDEETTNFLCMFHVLLYIRMLMK